jgi:predicted Zn-ribbon and HTH transcriptional regulator
MPQITLRGYLCKRCGHKWLPKEEKKDKPKACPKCKSPYWDTHRRLDIAKKQQDIDFKGKRRLR